jgi:hypothetical protein
MTSPNIEFTLGFTKNNIAAVFHKQKKIDCTNKLQRYRAYQI